MPAHKAGLFCILIVVHAALDVLRNQDFLATFWLLLSILSKSIGILIKNFLNKPHGG